METISFDKYEVTLPKGNLSEEWEILKSYMDIKLKNYKYEEPKVTEEEKPFSGQTSDEATEHVES